MERGEDGNNFSWDRDGDEILKAVGMGTVPREWGRDGDKNCPRAAL